MFSQSFSFGRLNEIAIASIEDNPQRFQLPNPHEPRQHSLSTVDGPMRSRTKSDLLGSRASAGRCTFEVLHTDVLLVGFHQSRKALSELLSDLLKNPTEQRHGV